MNGKSFRGKLQSIHTGLTVPYIFGHTTHFVVHRIT